MKKLLILFLPLLMLTSCIKNGDKTPLGWCIWEVQKHEGYEDCAYTYQEIYANDIQKEATSGGDVDAYIITTYAYPYRTEWCCFIEYKRTIKRYLNEKDVLYIDCDIVWENCYE